MPSTNSDNTPRRSRLQLSATQLIASALAAVTATFAASYLGVSGTVIGAAIASVVTVTGNAVYGHSIHRTGERVRSAVPIGVRWQPPRLPDGLEQAPTAVRPARPVRRPRSPMPRRLAVASVAVFAAVLALVTSVELVAGRPLSDLLRGTSGQGTTVFGPSQAHAGSKSQQPTPTTPATVTQTVTPDVVVTTPTVTRTAPPVTATTTPTSSPSAPSAAATPSGSPATSGSASPTGVPAP